MLFFLLIFQVWNFQGKNTSDGTVSTVSASCKLGLGRGFSFLEVDRHLIARNQISHVRYFFFERLRTPGAPTLLSQPVSFLLLFLAVQVFPCY